MTIGHYKIVLFIENRFINTKTTGKAKFTVYQPVAVIWSSLCSCMYRYVFSLIRLLYSGFNNVNKRGFIHLKIS